MNITKHENTLTLTVNCSNTDGFSGEEECGGEELEYSFYVIVFWKELISNQMGSL